MSEERVGLSVSGFRNASKCFYFLVEPMYHTEVKRSPQ